MTVELVEDDAAGNYGRGLGAEDAAAEGHQGRAFFTSQRDLLVGVAAFGADEDADGARAVD